MWFAAAWLALLVAVVLRVATWRERRARRD